MEKSDLIGVVIFLGVVFVESQVSAHEGLVFVDEDYWKNETPLQCYDCNSLYDPRCGDPFNPYSIGVVNCSERKVPEGLVDPQTLGERQRLKPTVCRKIVQKVEGVIRVKRGCGYIKNYKDDQECLVRSGTVNVNVKYCACTKSLCNGSRSGYFPGRFGLYLSLIACVSIYVLIM